MAAYYAIKIIRLSDRFDFVALKGGRSPHYLVMGILFLLLDRVFDLVGNWLLVAGLTYQTVGMFNDAPGALSGLFIAMGLREMYEVYVRNSKIQKTLPAHDEVWETEKMAQTIEQ